MSPLRCLLVNVARAAAPFAALILTGAVVVASPGVALAASKQGGESYTFAFRDAELSQVAQEVLGAAGVPFAIDPAVTGRISFRIEQRLTREQLLAAFEAVLEANGVALVRNGDILTVTPQAKAKSSAGVRRSGEQSRGGGYEVVAVPLSYAQPSEVAKALEAISSSSGVVYTNDKLGLLLLGGSGSQMKSTMDTLKIFDQSGFEDSKIRWFELSQAQAQTVASELDRIVQGAGLVGVTIVPLRRLNGIIVFARSGQAITELAKWVTRLDTPGREAMSSLWVYHPRATSAEDLAKTLNSVMGFQSASQTSASAEVPGSAPPAGVTSALSGTTSIAQTSVGGTDDQVRIGVDKPSNTLIIFAPPGRWMQLQRILSEIDRTPRQILIEASILEVTLNRDFEFGVDWSVLSKDVEITSINSGGGIGPSSPGLSVTFLSNNIDAAVHALGARTAVEVVSAPKIIALDSRTARLQVGDQVPVVTQAAQSRNDSNAALVNTVEYRSTGIILNVTPRVTGDNQLVLEVSQEVSSVAKTATSGIDSPTIQQRRFESALVLHDGGTVALGGLISTTRSTGSTGVPWLKEIPAVGQLFKTQSKNRGRSELIVLLSARIIGDRTTSDSVMNNLMSDMQELQARGLLPTRSK